MAYHLIRIIECSLDKLMLLPYLLAFFQVIRLQLLRLSSLRQSRVQHTIAMPPKTKRAPVSSESASDDDEDVNEDSASGSGSEVEVENQENGKDNQNDNHNEVESNEAIPEINIDVTSLNPLSPIVIQKQATINIGRLQFFKIYQKRSMKSYYNRYLGHAGTIGHVAHGKSTVVKAISGVQTVRFKNELERNITIKLGYANAKVFPSNNTGMSRHRLSFFSLLDLSMYQPKMRTTLFLQILLVR